MNVISKTICVFLLIGIVFVVSGCSGNSETNQASTTNENQVTNSISGNSYNNVAGATDESEAITKTAEQFLELHISTGRDVLKSPEKYDELITPACKNSLYTKYDRATNPDGDDSSGSLSSSSTVKMSVVRKSTFIQENKATEVKTLSPVYIGSEVPLPTGNINTSEPYLVQLKLVKTDKWRVDEIISEISLYQVTSSPLHTLFP